MQEKIKEKSNLEKMIEKLKFDLKSNNFTNLEMYFNDSFANRKIISEIKKIDFSEFEIMISKPKLYKNTASNTAAGTDLKNQLRQLKLLIADFLHLLQGKKR